MAWNRRSMKKKKASNFSEMTAEHPGFCRTEQKSIICRYQRLIGGFVQSPEGTSI